MKELTDYIIDYADNTLSMEERNWFEKELLHNNELQEKYMLFNQINKTMRGRIDYFEAINDPDRKSVDQITSQMVSDFDQSLDKFNQAKEFIMNSINENSDLANELEKTRQEAINSNVSHETQKWVDEWIENKTNTSSETEKRREFITSSLDEKQNNSNKLNNTKRKNLTIGIIGMAAAAAIAAIVMVKTLTPTYTPNSLYTEYYKPLNAYSTTTRNNANVLDPFSNAVALYYQTKYKSALAIFTDLSKQEPNNQAYLFFRGITYMGLEDYNNAIVLLSKVVSSESDDYKKESKWYLGLSYLKTGEIEKASKYLTELSNSNGYYQSQAQDLLAHLK